MIEITDEIRFAAIYAFAEKRKGDKSTYNGLDWQAMCAAITAVAPLIEAQVREQMAEDRMAGEILRAMMAADHGQFNMPLLGRQNGRWFYGQKSVWPRARRGNWRHHPRPSRRHGRSRDDREGRRQMITAKVAAAALDGNEYGKEGSKELWAQMKAAGLVAVFGASDDLMEFEGTVSDEIGAWKGAKAYFTSAGLLTNDCDNGNCPHFKRLRERAATIKAIWAPEDEDLSWRYETAIPHETFNIMEDGGVYCRGIVFALADVKEGDK